MKLKLFTFTKHEESFIAEGAAIYKDRLKHYTTFEIENINLKVNPGLPVDTQKQKEGEAVLKKTGSSDFLVLLDDKGKNPTSEEFSKQLEMWNIAGRNVVFVIGGAYGFDKSVYDRANLLLSLSRMTLPHQLVKLVFLEQLYRALTILKGEKYHHS